MSPTEITTDFLNKSFKGSVKKRRHAYQLMDLVGAITMQNLYIFFLFGWKNGGGDVLA